MRVFKTTYRDRHQQSQKTSKWYAEFRDQNEILRRLPAFTSKAASEEFGRNMEKLVAYHRATGGQVDPSLQTWLNGLPRQTQRKLAEINLIESRRTAAGIPLEQHLRDFTESLKAKGNTVRHVDLVTGRIRTTLNGCGFRYWSDITASKVQKYLVGLRDGKNGISLQTFNFYLQAVKQFCRWMVREKRGAESPLAYLGSLNVRTDRCHDRRALNTDELILLLCAANEGPARFGMAGSERALVYRLAVETGLRAGEIRSLTRTSFLLEGESPVVTVKASYSKSRRENILLLRPQTAALLKKHLSAISEEDAFAMPQREHVAKMVRADLAAARAKWLLEAAEDKEESERRLKSDFLLYKDRDSRVADFHALRHTFISNLAAGGVHPKTAQVLARHSTFALTMERNRPANRICALMK